jgi:hemoglobin/transferrin/lactoferrin receptor protein
VASPKHNFCVIHQEVKVSNFVTIPFLYQNMSKLSFSAFSFFIVLGLRSSFAQSPDSLKTKQLNEVVVTSTRGEKTVFQTPALIYAIGQEEIKASQSRSTPELLMNQMGVFVQKTTHGAGSPFVRGLTGNQTLLLIDDIRLNNSTFRYGPNQYLNTIDAFTLGRAEVLLGSGSVQYGSDALGGTIQLFTTAPEFNTGFSGRVLGRLVSAGMEQSGRVEARYGGANAAFQAGFTHRRFGDVLGGQNTGFQSPSGYKEQDFDLKAKLILGRGWMATLAHQSVSQRNVEVFFRYQLENFKINQFDPQRRQLTYIKLENQSESNWFNHQTFTVSRQATQEGRLSQKNGTTALRSETDKVQTWGLTYNNQSRFLRGMLTLNSGVELYRDHVNSERYDENNTTLQRTYSRGLYPDNSTFLNYAAYSIVSTNLARLNSTFGIRYNGFVIDIPDATIGDSRLTPAAFVYNYNLSYNLGKSIAPYLNISTGFRAPNIDDLGTLGIVDFRYEVPTNNLKPEKSTTYELGLKIATKTIGLQMGYYSTQLQNLITRVRVPNEQVNGINVYRKENVEKAYINGFDAKLQTNLLTSLQLYGNISYCFGQSETKNEPMRRIPPVNGRVGLNFSKNNAWVRPEFWFAGAQERLAQGDKDDNRIAKGGTPAWNVFNLNAGYTLKKISFTAAVQNLFDADYRTHGSGINGYGRSLWLTAEFKW